GGGDERVVLMGLVEDLNPGIHQLGTDRDRHGAADQARNEREHQVHRADVLVVGRIEKAPPAVRDFVGFLIAIGSVCHRIHCQSLRLRPLVAAGYDHHRIAGAAVAASALCAASLSIAYFCLALLSQLLKSPSFTTCTAIGMKA